MMSNHRDGKREAIAAFKPRRSLVMLVILVNVAVFVLQNLLDSSRPGVIYANLALSVDGLKHGCFWQLISFQFLHLPLDHAGIFHLLGNGFMIYLLGRPVENALGPAGFLKLYAWSGVAGGLLQMAGGFLAPDRFGLAVVGASAGTFGLLAAFATLEPKRTLHLFFFPIGVRADVLFVLGVAATLAGLFIPSGHVAHCAHLGGILTGFALARQWRRNGSPLPISGHKGKSSLEIAPVSD